MINFTGGLIQVGKNYYIPGEIKKIGEYNSSLKKTRIEYKNGENEVLENVTAEEFADAFIKTQSTNQIVAAGREKSPFGFDF